MGRLCLQGADREMFTRRHLQTRILQEIGPAGCAIIRVRGTRTQIVDFLERDYSPEMPSFYTARITRVGASPSSDDSHKAA
jgi:hypothetical protein